MNADDERALRAALEAQCRAWESADATAYGSGFTQDCRYVAFFGGIYRGRDEVVDSHRLLWAGVLKGTRLFVEVIEIRFLGPDTAVVLTRGEVAKQRPSGLHKVQSYTMVRDADGAWRCAHFQNTKRLSFARWLTYRLGPAAVPSMDR